MIHLDRISRQFGPQILFEGLSWLLPGGARIGLVGPNGAGKTTLLRLLAALDEPDAGTINRPRGFQVGYLPQEVETIGEETVLASVLDGAPELRQLEEEIQQLEARLAALRPEDAEGAELTHAYGETRHRFEALGGDLAEARARAVLTGLGVPKARFGEPLALLSGGWRMRVVLARLLLASPDLLLLDEPTNHLDLDAIDWLEHFLDGFSGTFVVVSHDRYFLNRMVGQVAELERGRLTLFTGNYDRYLEEKAARDARQEKAAKEQAREVARVERFVERFRYKATKARQVQERLRALSKVERIEAPSRAARIRFGFPPAPRSGDVVVRVEGLVKEYGEIAVYTGCDLRLRRGDRVALVGPNGSGKSTLLKLLAGQVPPDEGTVALGENVHVRSFAQHQLEALDPRATVLEELEKEAEPGARQRLRNLLGRFLFSGDDIDKKVGNLSGGEKARLALARMLIRPANLLLLDEPTNHLDLRSREVLEEALDDYDGTLVVVSHDRYFINRIATSIGEVGDGRVRLYPGDYDTFLDRHAPAASPEAPPAQAEADARRGEAAAPPATGARDEERALRRAEAEERNRRYRERRKVQETLAPIEAEIATLEARVRELDQAQGDPAVYRDGPRAREVGQEKSAAQARLADLYWRWEEVAAKLPPE
jgi:ATP-binding cassette subfamily F protein 3